VIGDIAAVRSSSAIVKRQIMPGANFYADANRLVRFPLFEFRNSIDNWITYCHVIKCAVGSNEKKGFSAELSI